MAVMNYEEAFDVNGTRVEPGHAVSIKRYPRGTVRGIVVVSDRQTVVKDGVDVPALTVVTNDGARYPLPPSRSVRVLKR